MSKTKNTNRDSREVKYQNETKQKKKTHADIIQTMRCKRGEIDQIRRDKNPPFDCNET